MKPSQQSETQIAKASVEAIGSMWPNLKVIRHQCGKVKVNGAWMQLAPEGTPDWQVLLPRSRSLWIEFKRPGERLSMVQFAWHMWAKDNEHSVAICESVVDAIRAVKDELKRWS